MWLNQAKKPLSWAGSKQVRNPTPIVSGQLCVPPSAKMLDLSVIIVNYNTKRMLQGCLDSAKKSLSGYEGGYEIIVIDNASLDGSAAMVAGRHPDVALLQNKINVGFAIACNQGISHSKGNYILLLNPDVVVLGSAIQELSAFLRSHPDVGLVGGKLRYPDGSFQHGAFRFPNLWMSFFDFFPLNYKLINSRLNGRYPFSAYQKPFEIDHPLGACMMVRRQVIEEVGPLSRDFFMYCEEIDWCTRIKRAGWRIYCQPKAELIHYQAQSTRQFREAMFVELHKSRFRLFKKHYSPAFRLMARLIVMVGIAREMLRSVTAYRRGGISASEYQSRMDAYTEVLRIIRADG